jgi:hypothetical protein
MREVMAERPETTNGEATKAPGANRQFDSNGLPVAPQPSAPNGVNGHHYGHGLPLEP